MKHSPRRQWEHLRSLPFSEIVDVLVEQQQRIDQLKELRDELLDHVNALHEAAEPVIGIARMDLPAATPAAAAQLMARATNLQALANKCMAPFERSPALFEKARR